MGFGGTFGVWGTYGDLGRDLWGLGVLWGPERTRGDPGVVGGPGDAGAEVTAGPSAAHAPGASSPPCNYPPPAAINICGHRRGGAGPAHRDTGWGGTPQHRPP